MAPPKQPYHRYVFDTERRKFIGKFEEMYQQEDIQGFDSWFQDDTTHITKRIALCILEQYNFNKILDIGCGKGAFTYLLKKNNNVVKGCDLSETAIRKAKSKFPSISFFVASSGDLMDQYDESHDLVILMEVLSYIENWEAFLQYIAGITEYCLITLYLPPNPIGFINNFDELKNALTADFTIEKELNVDQSVLILLLHSK